MGHDACKHACIAKACMRTVAILQRDGRDPFEGESAPRKKEMFLDFFRHPFVSQLRIGRPSGMGVTFS